jgi:hypothetical protein
LQPARRRAGTDGFVIIARHRPLRSPAPTTGCGLEIAPMLGEIMAPVRAHWRNRVDYQPMSFDEVQRAMQFLLAQQAASDARFETLMAQLSKKTDQVAEGLIGLTSIVGRVVESVSTIAEGQKRTDEQLAKLAARTDLVESHLNVVIEMFERHLREDHGSRPS